MAKIGIIGAMDVEVRMLTDKMTGQNGLGKPEKTTIASVTYYDGLLEGVPAVVVKSGIGKVNAALCAQRLILLFGVSHVINTGIAGGTARGLGVLDMVISTDALYHDMDATGFGYPHCVIPQMDTSDFVADEKMVALASETFAELEKIAGSEFSGHKLIAGRIASGDQFVSDNAEKDRIREICNPVCVEMEGAAIAHACFLNKIPFLVIRCISDMADDGGESTYSFNEDTAAKMSAHLVLKMLAKIQ